METGKKLIPENREKESQVATDVFDEKAVFQIWILFTKTKQNSDKGKTGERQEGASWKTAV